MIGDNDQRAKNTQRMKDERLEAIRRKREEIEKQRK